MWKIFYEKYKKCVETYIPKTNPKPGCQPKPLWLTFDCLSNIKRKQKAWSRYLATRRAVDFDFYKVARNRANENVRKAKKEYEKLVASKAKTEPKHFWTYVKSKVKSKSAVSNLMKPNGNLTTSDKEKATVLNDFFTSVFTAENPNNIPNIEERNFESSLDHFVINQDTVEKYLLLLNGSKSMGPDNIHPLIVKNDTKIYAPTSKSDVLQNDLDALYDWSKLWDMKFNVNKCKQIHYGRNNPENVYTMNNIDIIKDEQEKDLGIIFQNDLKFSQHISSKINKANSILGLINRTFIFKDQYTFLRLYVALVRPHVEYGNTIWYPHLKKDINAVEKVQMRATKLIPDIRHLSYEDRLKVLKLPSLTHRRRRGDMIQAFKILKGFEDISYERFFTVISTNTRGHNWKLAKPRCNTSFRLRHFSQRIINDWNNLPVEVISSKTVEAFKISIDRHWESVMYQLRN
ncbi:unnamed protein product [Mytilus edulis]|uniref:Reverse transcriptase domain-containing protein n=1 Tax=Mytilus edulis TaxID=6550 RepID=A0A8S3RL87_MYTED|nr:unnamed protein product [Mytilus edulis]